jgi:DNA polymerase-3 subunit alpha
VKVGKIRFGLGSIKNVGTVPVDNIVKERNNNGPYKGFTDFCERIADEAVNKKCVESLIKAGAFSEFEQTRSTLLASFESIMDTIQSGKKKGFKGQVSMFDLGTEEEKEQLNEIKYTFEEYKEMPNKELLSLEKEFLGIYISGHPLEKLRTQIEMQTNIDTIKLREIDEQMSSNLNDPEMELLKQNTKLKYKDGQNVKYAGIISSIKKKYTKNNKIMAFVTIEDLYGTAEVLVFENAYFKAGKSLVEENIVMVEGRLSIREDETTTIIANEIRDFGEQKQKVLTLDITNSTEEEKDKLRGALRYFNGDKNNINVQIQIGEETKPCGQIYITEEILEIFKEIIGYQKVIVKEI